MAQRAFRAGSPREFDVAFFDPDELPLAWKLEIGPVEPPDVLAARVQQLHLEIVGRRIGAQVERDLVAGRQVERQRAPRQRVPGGPGQVEVEA